MNSDRSDIQPVTWLVLSLRNTLLKRGYEPWHSNKSLKPEAEASGCKSVNSLIYLDNKTGIIHKAVTCSVHFGQLKDTEVFLYLKHMLCIEFAELELSVVCYVIDCSNGFLEGFRPSCYSMHFSSQGNLQNYYTKIILDADSIKWS